uniref:Nitric oxide reductase NorD protein n=1 Tax=Candidatus Kentrum sp. TC TaxID=2126339 RepID=A0A450ZFG2_9GAMM|nr:MAG: nitric oxide reductase NorD protein [Candidatus Kentron sp. TC]VFK52542.1 MAG: nitric oxide reductase NorD protein [Candidatus Kentron sp. TC]VFK64926.1 MAG: nitric oxide reductase NorD protein [Candidatus Kentron sp. TC]
MAWFIAHYIKDFGESYDREVKARISGISPGDYTRMGPAIRYLGEKLKGLFT